VDSADTTSAEPTLGYNDTGGYDSNSDTSREAAYHDLVTGITAKAQRLTMILAYQQGKHGITIAELREAKGALHHGKMSSALTNLHKGGRLARLAERRGRCHVYVVPEFVDERETQQYRANRPQVDRTELIAVLAEHRPTTGNSSGVYCSAVDWSGNGRDDFREHVADVIIETFGR
jgi:hypothetical protein